MPLASQNRLASTTAAMLVALTDPVLGIGGSNLGTMRARVPASTCPGPNLHALPVSLLSEFRPERGFACPGLTIRWF